MPGAGVVVRRRRRLPLRRAGQVPPRSAASEASGHAGPAGQARRTRRSRATQAPTGPGKPGKPGQDKPGSNRGSRRPRLRRGSAPSTSGSTTAATATRGASRCATAPASWPGGSGDQRARRTSTTTSAASTGATPRTGTTPRATLGYLVDDVPAIGAVAQTDDGSKGHVAWVESVGDGTVTVEEYNYGVAGGYDVRTVPTSSFRYLHLRDVAPEPNLGSTRAGVATTDAHGGSWSAHTTADGQLVVRRPSGRATRLAAPDGWSPQAAPSVLTDSQGRVWVVRGDGVRTRPDHAHDRRSRDPGPPTAGPRRRVRPRHRPSPSTAQGRVRRLRGVRRRGR